MLSQSRPRLRLMLLDDHELVRQALAHRLQEEHDLLVVGSFGSAQPLMSALTTTPTDVLVVDYSLGPSDIDGPNLIRALRVRYPATKVLVVSSHHQSTIISLALQAGAQGFVGKWQSSEEFIAAIRAVARGRVYIDPLMTAEIADSKADGDTFGDARALTDQAKLSPREREVLRCCLDGMKVSDIAAKFSRSVNTISTQKQAALRKLGIKSDHELFKIRHMLER